MIQFHENVTGGGECLTLLLTWPPESAIALSLGRYYFLIRACTRTHAHAAIARSRGIEVKSVYKPSVRALRTRIRAPDRPDAHLLHAYELPARTRANAGSSVPSGDRCPWRGTIWHRGYGFARTRERFSRKKAEIADLRISSILFTFLSLWNTCVRECLQMSREKGGKTKSI